MNSKAEGPLLAALRWVNEGGVALPANDLADLHYLKIEKEVLYDHKHLNTI